MDLQNFSHRFRCLDVLRVLLIAEVAALFVSTSLTSLLEILVVACVLLCAGQLRPRVAALARQPLAVMVLLFAGLLCLGAFYGPAPMAEKLDILKGWRKLLLLPIALAVFDEYAWKLRLAWIVIAAALAGMLLSYLGVLGVGKPIVIHNHATQGIFFATAAFATVVLLFTPGLVTRPGVRRGLAAGAVLLALNIIFVTPGRGGYLVLLVYAVIAGFSLFRGWLRLLLPVAVPLLILLLLAVSPVATKRISLGFDEMRDYEQSRRITSMGIRMMMWRNTLLAIQERPLLGHGLGGLKEAYARRVEGLSGWRGTVVDDPHNQFLKTTVESGLVGLAVFLLFLAAFFRQEVGPPHRLLGLGVLLAWCASSMFAGHFSTWAEGRFLLLWAGAQLAMAFPPVESAA